MAPDKLAEVFEPFGQVDSSRTRAHGGAGLGLAICHRLVDAMGGEIRLDSTRGPRNDRRRRPAAGAREPPGRRPRSLPRCRIATCCSAIPIR
jgi:nitrogen fixation/metabolism regulation signal transduction histidine kinase